MPIRITITNALRVEEGDLDGKQIHAIKKALTMPNPAHESAVKYGRSTWNIPQFLFFFQHENGNLVMPRGFARTLHRMDCMRGAEIVWEDRRRLCPEVNFNFSGELRPYQVAAVEQVLKGSQGVLEAGTGAGKTVMALAAVAKRKQPALVIVHNKELSSQWVDQARRLLGVDPGRVGAKKLSIKPLTIGIVNTVRKCLDQLVPHFGHVVVDECHRCPSTMFADCVAAFDAHYLLGLSATPFRRDGLTKAIHHFLGPKIHEVDQGHLQEVGAILQPKIQIRRTDFAYPKDGAENYQEMLGALTQDQARNNLIADDVKNELARDAGTCLVVSDRVAHLEALKAALLGHGLEMAILTGKTPSALREAIVDQVQEGKIKILGSTLQLIGEGFDCPGLSSLFLTTPIKFQGRLLQVVGRILRPQAGKIPILYDYKDPVGVLMAAARAREEAYGRYTRQAFVKKKASNDQA